jgi:hypothetical protein
MVDVRGVGEALSGRARSGDAKIVLIMLLEKGQVWGIP